MNIRILAGRGIAVKAHDIALGIDSSLASVSRSLEGAGEINRPELALAEQKEVGPALGTDVASQDLAARVDLVRMGFERAGDINGREFAVAEQEAVGVLVPIQTLRGCDQAVTSHDVAAGVNPKRQSGRSAGEIDLSELAILLSQVSVPFPLHKCMPHDVAAGVNPICIGGGTPGEINPRKLAILASQKAVAAIVGSAVVQSDNLATSIDINGIGEATIATRGINGCEGLCEGFALGHGPLRGQRRGRGHLIASAPNQSRE